jgi:hypothetical protein
VCSITSRLGRLHGEQQQEYEYNRGPVQAFATGGSWNAVASQVISRNRVRLHKALARCFGHGFVSESAQFGGQVVDPVYDPQVRPVTGVAARAGQRLSVDVPAVCRILQRVIYLAGYTVQGYRAADRIRRVVDVGPVADATAAARRQGSQEARRDVRGECPVVQLPDRGAAGDQRRLIV